MDDIVYIYYALGLDDEEWDNDAAHDALLSGAAIYIAALGNQQHRSGQRRRLYIVRNELLPNPRRNTPWQKLLNSRSDRAYITTMGIDVETFQYILNSGFTALWNATALTRHDNPMTAAPQINRRSLDAAGGLGLLLHYLNSTMLDISLMEIFALIPSTVFRYIEFTMDILLSVLCGMRDATIEWPEGDQFQEYNELVTIRHPLLTGAFGVMDGLNLAVQESADQETENAMYNGWLHDHFVSSVIAFGSTGVVGIILCIP